MRGDARNAEQLRSRIATTVRSVVVAGWLALAAGAWLAGLVHPALRAEDGAARTLTTAALWLAYGLVLGGLLLPGSRGLTVARIGVPAGAAQLVVASAADSFEAVGWVGLIGGLAATVVVLQPVYAEAHVDAASYGDERRFLLRPPGPVVVAVVVPVWAVAVAGVAAGPLLLTGAGWATGIVAAAVGLPIAAVAAHILFRLARRWLVFVPNGLVVHDHMAVAEPLPLGRRGVASIGPARAETTAADLTAQAFGMALELRLNAPVKIGVMTGRNRSEERSLTALLLSPSRPAAVLATAERRGLKLA